MCAYLSRDVHANMKRQIGMQIAPTWPGTKRASGSTMAPGFAARGWYEKYSHSMYAITDTTAPTRIPKNATRIHIKDNQRGLGLILTALLNSIKVVDSIKHCVR